jgi:hypothetical protein
MVRPQPGSYVPAPVFTGGIIRIFIHFSQSFDSEVTQVLEECVFKISLRPFFPNTLPPVSLRSARWLSKDRLLLEWEGPEAGNSVEPHFYRLLIPGGTGGIHNGRGSYLKEDLFLYLEAE